jgi:hypothetical protein
VLSQVPELCVFKQDFARGSRDRQIGASCFSVELTKRHTSGRRISPQAGNSNNRAGIDAGRGRLISWAKIGKSRLEVVIQQRKQPSPKGKFSQARRSSRGADENIIARNLEFTLHWF